jgi:hypothetical protein
VAGGVAQDVLCNTQCSMNTQDAVPAVKYCLQPAVMLPVVVLSKTRASAGMQRARCVQL